MVTSAGLQEIANFLTAIGPAHSYGALYRGHSNGAWPLQASAFRDDADGITKRGQLQRWKSVAARFVQPRPQNDFEWLVLAQHYGIATPLLDWTTNPLIALFFACQKVDPRADGCVLRIDPADFPAFENLSTADPFAADRPQPVVIDTSGMNDRTLAQDSIMTLHSAETAELKPTDENIFLINARRKTAITLALKTFGFSEERLYFDLTLAAREFSQDLIIESVFGENEDL